MRFDTVFKQLVSIFLAATVLLASPGVALSQSTTSPTPAASSPSGPPAHVSPPGGDPWPRELTYQGAKISIYQPQLETWTGNMLEAYTAVIIKPHGSNSVDYGVIWFTARTEVDKINRVVTLEDFRLTKQNFPSLPSNGVAYSGAFQKEATWTQSMPLDQLQSSLAVTPIAEKQQRVEVKNDPPTIIFSMGPAVLALIDGAAVLSNVENNLQKVLNTRALIVFDPDKNMYYLALMDGWVESHSLQGPWSVAKHEPKKDLDKVKQAALQADQNQVLGNPDQSLKDAFKDFVGPTVYVSTTPAELILTQGEPQFTPMLGTNLLYVTNTGDDIFMDSANSQYYILVSGRWFVSTSIQNGPWAYVPATSLPSDFSKIPDYSPKASVLRLFWRARFSANCRRIVDVR